MTKKKYGIRTVNGNEPDPETGNVEVSIKDNKPVSFQSTKDGGNIFSGEERITYFGSGIYNGLETNWQPDLFRSRNDTTNQIMEFRTTGIEYIDQNNYASNSLSFIKTTPNTSASYIFPEKSHGPFVLATTDDSVPYTGALNDLNMGGKVIKVGLNDATPATITTLGYSNGLSGFVSDSPGAKVSYDMQRIEALDKRTGFKKHLYFNASAGKKDYIVSLPNKDGELATTDDIAVLNNTSTALSSTFLNATYPDALVGFQVICDSLLSSGGEHTIYVKSQTGWLKILGEPVP
ncbi:hypothetical protein C8C83_3319 [Flavobacterium sp. 90]|uniref:hypothetical protein n=1 Tax=unclassified Flavobacterium TaxID=196869 RepID=UPI000EAD932B|nr:MULTISPECIES: hypothetical protein [unclassified Flavobacterium]RKR11579.1 hypothetical protein C8C82_3630 [Flavobacterium sp. 81]TCK55360.1 hypothetical protein C8C83_3319 [Flavobacterium sp. 90]